MKERLYIDPDIRKAETLPAWFYKDADLFDLMKERVFASSWQWIGDEYLVPLQHSVYPFVLMDQYLTEPLVLSRDADDQIRCCTNVCTHRGNIIVQTPGKARSLLCGYHGRRFELNGKFKSMPEFQEGRRLPPPLRRPPIVPDWPMGATLVYQPRPSLRFFRD